MAYTNRPADNVMERSAVVSVADYHDRVRWGPIIAGLVVSISTQLVLTGLGAAIGLTTLAGSDAPQATAGDVGLGVGIWSIVSLFIALFVGSWVMARTCGPMNKRTALLNGVVLWATTLVISSWLLTTGVTGTFGVLASNAGNIINQVQQPGGLPGTIPDANVTPEESRTIASNAAKVGWSFAIGALLGLVASLIGATAGARNPRTNTYTTAETPVAR